MALAINAEDSLREKGDEDMFEKGVEHPGYSQDTVDAVGRDFRGHRPGEPGRLQPAVVPAASRGIADI